MRKLFTICVSQALRLLVVGSAACNVYDPALLREVDSSGHPVQANAPPIDAGSPEIDSDSGQLEQTPPMQSAQRCGNSVVDANEHCDIAIAHGEPGACPDGCSGRGACTEHVLIGRACEAHCEDMEIHASIPDDGCCPAGATPDVDDDCVAVCGNGIRERGELCDPPETCVSRESCVSHAACVIAHYSGDPARCSASCELQAVQACVDGDGCCPTGCTAARDKDCPAETAKASCDAGCSAPADEAPACQSLHAGGDCERCDCEHCAQQTQACASAPDSDAKACNAVVQCASTNHCSGLDCYCGISVGNRCAQLPLGPCVAQLRAAAGSGDVRQLILQGLLGSGSLGRALGLLECRAAQCASACGLGAL